MGRKNSSFDKEVDDLIVQYETAKAEDKQIYLDADQLAEIADRYLVNRKYKEAKEVIDYGLELHPQNTDLLIELAYFYMNNEKMEEAWEVANSIKEDYETEVKILKAELFLEEEKVDEANKVLSEIEDIGELDTLIDIISVYLDMGYAKEAEPWIQKGKALYADEVEFIDTLTEYYTDIEQFETAIIYYNQLIDINPYSACNWVGLANCYIALENGEKAVEACELAIAANEYCSEAYIVMGNAYLVLDNYDAAIEHYRKAIEIDALPKYMGHLLIAMAYTKKNDWENAYNTYMEMSKLVVKEEKESEPMLLEIYFNAAYAAIQNENFKAAHRLCKKALPLQDSDNPTAYLINGHAYVGEDLIDKAEKEFKKALSIERSEEMLSEVAGIYYDAGYLLESKPYYKELLELDPEDERAIEKLCLISISHGDPDDFIKYNELWGSPFTVDVLEEIKQKYDDDPEVKESLQRLIDRLHQENEKNNNNI